MKFSDFVTLQRGFDLPKTEMRDGPFPVLGSTSVIGHHCEFKVEPPGVVTGRSGSLGIVQYVDKPYWPHNTALWVRDFKGNDPKFVFYCMKGLDFARFNAGAGVPTLNRNHLDSLEVGVPSLSVQRRIASILSAYDDLIENSQRRIKILESMARALYREWFVHFRFPGHENHPRVASPLGEIPAGWEAGTLENMVVLQRGFDLPKSSRKGGVVPIIAATGVTGLHDEAKVRAPGVVTGRSGSIGEVMYIQEDFWPLNTALWAKEFPRGEPLVAYYLLSSLDLKQFNSGAAVPTLNRNDIHGISVVIPPIELQRRFQQVAGDMHAQCRKLALVVDNLRRTRDLLLPRLLSGQIALDELEAA
jgi:type I restriction enzyme S subunit